MSNFGKLQSSLLSVVSFLLTAGICMAQMPQLPLAIQKIKGNIYLVKGGSGANTGFYVSEKEVVVIDAKMTADSTKQAIQEIKNVTPNPISRIILTHGDGDHVNGLNGFPTGLKIYGHPQTKKDLEEASKAQNTQHLRDYLPNETCSPCTASNKSVMDIQLGKEKIQLHYFGAAHTSGDFVVYFPTEKVAFVGDLAFTGRDPLIHRFKGGSSTGLLETLKGMLALDAETYLSGHSDPLSKKDIQDIYNSIADKREKVRSMVAEGKSLDEIKKAFGVATGAAQPGRMTFMSLAEVIYLDLMEKK
jgi:glyoxylase-like metal-dependent hydrolase (beta-lactamase superfamily II)